MCKWSPTIWDGPSAYSEKWRKARQTHCCCECGGTIRQGETYRYISGVWDGRWESYKHCRPCAEVWDGFADEHGADPYLRGLEDALGECVREETRIDDDDNEVLTESGRRWQKALDDMAARREAANA